ncbi:MAG: hypothetical protein FJX74_05315 [Armatimonadetes bacterium]|nr:hypothetical protein [Armatimonadota bacterium]
MGLFTGEDVEARPSLWRSAWFLAFLAADLPVDTAIGLIVAMPRLETALSETELAMPAATVLLIRLGHVLAARWWLILPPIALAPFLAAWRWREATVRPLQIAVIVELILFAALCVVLLLPIHTIVQAG